MPLTAQISEGILNAAEGYRLWVAGAVTVAFALIARWLRGVTPSGAIAGAAVCFVLYAGAGIAAFAVLASVFALTWISTRFGYRRKQSLGTAQNNEGRTASQVLANLAVSAICVGIFTVTGRMAFILAMTAALAEAASDTVSSEIGQAHSEKARLITTWELVPAGMDGGVTLFGTGAGITAAVLVGLVALGASLISLLGWGIVVLAAACGTVADSYLGALLERRKLLNNDWVNVLGTLVAATVALLLA